jgi:hypothetical protein
MKIMISDSRKVNQLQEQFTEIFPFLKLEFFSRPHKVGQGSARKMLKNQQKTIGECRTIHNKGHINITPSMSVAQLEQQFRELYGLNVQVFRKSGSVWLETTVTDSWSLEKQNTQGEALSTLITTRPHGTGPRPST